MADLKKLAEPFDPAYIEWFVGSTTRDKTRGLAIPYITKSAVQRRLDEVCGVDGWKNKYRTISGEKVVDTNGALVGRDTSHMCKIIIWSEKRQEWIDKEDGADETDIEAFKGGLSSAMKRAGAQWGIGRYLNELENPWVEIEQRGNSHVIKPGQKLILPDWAMPGGSGTPGPNESRTVIVQIIDSPNYNAPSTGNQQQGFQRPAQQGNRPLSEKQVNRALAKAATAGQDIDSVKLWIEKQYGVDDISRLNRQQYDALCDALDKAAN